MGPLSQKVLGMQQHFFFERDMIALRPGAVQELIDFTADISEEVWAAAGYVIAETAVRGRSVSLLPAETETKPAPRLPAEIEAFLANSKRPYIRQLLKLLGIGKTYEEIAEEIGKITDITVRNAVRAFCITAGVYPGPASAGDLREIARNKAKELGFIDD